MPTAIPSDASDAGKTAEEGAPSGSITLLETDGFSLDRRGRFLSARLRTPHLTLSTSHVNGGQTERVRYLVNHQNCEGKGHMARHDILIGRGQDAYHREACAEAGVPAEATALMGTAANMQYASVRAESFEDVSVWAAVTAGVQGNAGRAGDPALWHETSGAWKPVHALPGTINTMVIFNRPLLPGALARAVMTMTEAKTAALLELAVGSRYSPHLATGTGTDQFCLAAPLGTASLGTASLGTAPLGTAPLGTASLGTAPLGTAPLGTAAPQDPSGKPLTWTGKHSKLGEILARAVIEATKDALRWQNGLDPSRTRNLIHALGRFGVDEAGLLEAAAAHLDAADGSLLRANFQAVLHDPLVAGAAYALAAVRDRIAFGTLPEASGRESLANQAALLAAGLAAKTEAFPHFRAALAADDADVPALAAKALALGWREKWK